MSKEIEAKLAKIPLINILVDILKRLRLPGFEGLSIYDLLEMYFVGIVRGALTYRASAISFSFFMAIFPFLLFLLNLIPYVPIDGFQTDFLNFVDSLLPPKTVEFFDGIISDIIGNRRASLLSSVFFLSILLMANGINAVFGGFETSYHVRITRNVVKQYFVSLGVALLLALLFLFAVIVYVYLQFLTQFAGTPVVEGVERDNLVGVRIGKFFFFVMISYVTTAVLYYFGTKEGKESRFFSPGALLTTILIILNTYLFGIYIENFSQYNEIYGSIGALLILMLYIWLNSSILLLGFELNASLRSLRRNNY
ncbi:YihY/virulence factor BrkB family protein [Robertkochia solimangrovi]|uniref:YihY/virulence factor BrkB family protein n=1 Tax=Robertkochia solimangrovi TaxID=2213046 RepID=UPI00118033DA|nr:YihY/virulence factor BrkB family protein [Robertkochia solimangrovi]TRZ43636.1 ribonuclease BN [Robertkochia solimangrovi]